MKKILSLILTLALVVTLIPIAGTSQQVEAAGSYFIFPNEQASKASARIVSSKYVNLTGTINGVVGSSISYKVEQVTLNSDVALNTTEDISTGIITTGDNSITVSNLELFPGLNKITFKGVAGTSTVEESIYIEFRDSPMLNDLKVLFENRVHEMVDDGVTMLYSQSSTTSPTGVITLDGYAPNAQKVTVEINNYSYDFYVSQAQNYRFSTSQLTINKGLNTIKFKVANGGQITETVRQIALYNGEVTYFDEKITDGIQRYDLTPMGSYSVDTSQSIVISGKAIIPFPLYDLSTNTTTPVDKTNLTAVTNALEKNMDIVLTINGTTTTHDLDISGISQSDLTSSTEYITVNYSFTADNSTRRLPADERISFTLRAPNLNQYDNSEVRTFILRDATKAYIADVNYLTGYDASMTSSVLSLTSTDIPATGVEVYAIPMAVEVLIANAGNNSIHTGNIENSLKTLINGKQFTPTVIKDANNVIVSDTIIRNVNGIDMSYLRVFVKFDRLDKAGSNTVNFSLSNAAAVTDPFTAVFKLQYGPYVKFDNVVDGMPVQFDSYKDQNADLVKRIGGLAGRIMNIANTNDIHYVDDIQNNQVQHRRNIFLYLNNVEIPIEPYTNANGDKNKSMFKPIGVTINDNGQFVSATPAINQFLTSIMNKAGENVVKFVIRTDQFVYESTIKFSVVPTNLPVIPAPGTDGVYPYTHDQWPPNANDPNFTATNGVYTTTQAEFDVFGTFDFIDLGTTKNQVEAVLSGNNINPEDYIVQISNPNWSQPIKWNLSNEFGLADRNRNILLTDPAIGQSVQNEVKINSNNPHAGTGGAVRFYYNTDANEQNFFFKISGEKMPEDGSPLVYVITVFNAGESGPRATYRLEVNPISIPFTIKSPVTEERIVNSNFVEVIIDAPGADSIIIGKEQMEKITYIDYNGTTQQNVKAFRKVITGLKANRAEKIEFTITRGDTTTTSSFEVTYKPTNIPGAQYLETMKNSHKVFNNTLTLSFGKNTNLIRPNYNDALNYATQVYNNHQILFAIANPSDGIVNRHMFEAQPPDYSANSQATGDLHIKTRFESYANRFIKASPLYWIDAGLADDPDNTPNLFDPITTGVDPFPFPNVVGKYTDNFSERYGLINRQIIPNTPGELSIQYDSSIVASAGTTITVFRFDPYTSMWENIGGVVDEKKGVITVPFEKFGYYVAVKLTRSYNDIIDHSYAREALEAIYSKGVMNAIEPVNRFGGDEYITRGEFTRMIVRALDIPLDYNGTLHFTYYPETITNASNPNAIYDYRYIETAARAGIVNGNRPGFFGEDMPITREEASVILARALELKLETDSKKARTQLDKAFLDGANFSFYSIPAVLAVQKSGFIVGKPVNSADPKAGYVFDPKARMLRSDAAIVMARVMNSMKKLPKIYN